MYRNVPLAACSGRCSIFQRGSCIIVQRPNVRSREKRLYFPLIVHLSDEMVACLICLSLLLSTIIVQVAARCVAASHKRRPAWQDLADARRLEALTTQKGMFLQSVLRADALQLCSQMVRNSRNVEGLRVLL